MSGKSKKITIDRTSRGENETKYASFSASKIVDRLSFSFYAEETMKKQKQFILDTYEETEDNNPMHKQQIRAISHSKKKLSKPKTPIMRIKQDPYIRAHKAVDIVTDREKEKNRSKNKERSSSKSSKGKAKMNEDMLKYLANRIDTSAKGWSAIKTLLKDKQIKKI